MKEPKKAVSLLLPLSTHEKLTQLAQESSRSLPSYIRQIIKHYLNHIEGQNEEDRRYIL